MPTSNKEHDPNLDFHRLANIRNITIRTQGSKEVFQPSMSKVGESSRSAFHNNRSENAPGNITARLYNNDNEYDRQ